MYLSSHGLNGRGLFIFRDRNFFRATAVARSSLRAIYFLIEWIKWALPSGIKRLECEIGCIQIPRPGMFVDNGYRLLLPHTAETKNKFVGLHHLSPTSLRALHRDNLTSNACGCSFYLHLLSVKENMLRKASVQTVIN